MDSSRLLGVSGRGRYTGKAGAGIGTAGALWAKKAGVLKPIFKSPHWAWWLAIPSLIALLTYLAIVSAIDNATLWAGFGNRRLGAIVQTTWVSLVLIVLTASVWGMHAIQASFAFSVASSRPTLEGRAWSWVAQTLLLGFPSMQLLQAEALKFDRVEGTDGRQSWSFVESMMIKPDAGTSSTEGSPQSHGGIVPGTCRHRVEHVVEAPALQLLILLLVLVDIMAVVLEVIVEVELVQFVDPEQGELIEEVLHFVSVGILTFFLLELSLLMYVYGKAFFVGPGSFWMKTDLFVVSISLILQLALHDGHGGCHGCFHSIIQAGFTVSMAARREGHEGDPEERELEYAGLAGLLILVRLPWRIIRIVHAVIVTLEKAHQEGHQEGEAEGREEEDEIMEKALAKELLKEAEEQAALDSEVAKEAELRREIAQLKRDKHGLEQGNATLALENRQLQEALTKLGHGPAITLTGESLEVGGEQGSCEVSFTSSRVESMTLDSGDERARRGSLNG